LKIQLAWYIRAHWSGN